MTQTPAPAPVPEEERLTAAVRVNLSPTELNQLQALAREEDRPVANVVRRAVRDLITQESETAKLRVALAAYRSALRSGEPETDGLREIGDIALGPLKDLV